MTAHRDEPRRADPERDDRNDRDERNERDRDDDTRPGEAAADPMSPGATIDSDEPAEPNEPA